MDELKVTENIILLTLKELNIRKSPGPDEGALKELNIRKSPGPDEIGARLLIELSENICLPLKKNI